MIKIIKDIDPITVTDEYDVILVGTNIYGKLSNGWQLDVKYKYPLVHKANLDTRYGDTSKIGKFIAVKEDEKPTICLLYINKSCNFRPDLKKEFVEYKSLEECLYRINIEYKGKKIICPILGSSEFDGNGDKEKLIDIFTRTCTDIEVDLYDYEQVGAKEKKLRDLKKIMEAKSLSKITGDRTEYKKLNLEQKEYLKRLKEINNLKNIN